MKIIKYSIESLPPDKSWDPIQVGEQVKNDKTHIAEEWIRQDYSSKNKGWLDEDLDIKTDWGAYTQLHLTIVYNSPVPIDPIAKTKCLLDGLAGAAYINDTSIVSICIVQRTGKPQTTVYLTSAHLEVDYRKMADKITHQGYITQFDPEVQKDGKSIASKSKKMTNEEKIAMIQGEYIEQGGLIGTGTKLTVCYYKAIRKQEPLAYKQDCLDGIYRPVCSPDVDNIAHLFIKALDGLAFTDPTQIQEIRVAKYYGLEDGYEYNIA